MTVSMYWSADTLVHNDAMSIQFWLGFLCLLFISHITPIQTSVVLTAAHCLILNNGEPLSVPPSVRVRPSTRQDGTEFRVDALNYRIHPGWDCRSATDCPGGQVGANIDLALLKLTGFSPNQVVCLNKDPSTPANGLAVDNMGVGLIASDPDVRPDLFQGASRPASDCDSNDVEYFCSSSSLTDPNICPGKSGWSSCATLQLQP